MSIFECRNSSTPDAAPASESSTRASLCPSLEIHISIPRQDQKAVERPLQCSRSHETCSQLPPSYLLVTFQRFQLTCLLIWKCSRFAERRRSEYGRMLYDKQRDAPNVVLHQIRLSSKAILSETSLAIYNGSRRSRRF